MKKDLVLGIDLGTTNSEVAVFREGQPRVLGDPKIMPSVVGLDLDGNLLVGEPALNQFAAFPDRTVRSIKRSMGKDVTVTLGDQTYGPSEISAVILRKLKQVAESSLDTKVEKAIITVPAYFSDAQRQATRLAGELAGLEVVRLINEPTAASMAYEAANPESKKILVYDLGGGTFDVSVVVFQDDVVEIKASAGDNHLGGDDFDQLVVDRLVGILKQAHGKNLNLDFKAMARLRVAAEKAKVHLSHEGYALIQEEFLCKHKGKPVHLKYELARSEFESMIEPLVDRTLEAVHRALQDARLRTSDIDEIILVGGATRTPCIGAVLEADFGLLPRSEISPDLCVALGAAVQAGITSGERVDSVLVDVTPYTFGTKALMQTGDVMPYLGYVPIIRRNTPIPVSHTEVFYTTTDNQDVVQVEIFQGEDPHPDENIFLGEFQITELSKQPEGSPITLKLDLDVDGILHVTATEKMTGLAKSVVIEGVLDVAGESLETSREKIADLLSGSELEHALEGGNEEDTGAVAKAKQLVAKSRSLLETVTQEDREEMVDLMEAIEEAITAENQDALAEPVEALGELLFYLEEA